MQSYSNRLVPQKNKNKNNPSGLVAGWHNSQVQHVENDLRSTRDTNYRQQHETKGTLQPYQFFLKKVKFSVVQNLQAKVSKSLVHKLTFRNFKFSCLYTKSWKF